MVNWDMPIALIKEQAKQRSEERLRKIEHDKRMKTNRFASEAREARESERAKGRKENISNTNSDAQISNNDTEDDPYFDPMCGDYVDWNGKKVYK